MTDKLPEKQEQKGGVPVLPVLTGLTLAYYFLMRPNLLTWGTKLGEAEQQLPGDDLILNPNMQATRGIDIEAPPEAVWPWLAQLGRDTTGFYNIDPLANKGIPSANYIRHDLPALEVGQTLDNVLKVLRADQPNSLIFGAFDIPNWFGTTTDLTMAYILLRQQGNRSRLVVRTRGYSFGLPGQIYNWLYEPLDFIQTSTQMQNIAELARANKEISTP
jgi:hypothetical protein